jgi:hypothetical protein
VARLSSAPRGSNPARYGQRTPRRPQGTCSPRPQQSAAYARRSKATARTVRVTFRNPSGKRIQGDIPRDSVTPRTSGSSSSEDRGLDLVSVLGGRPCSPWCRAKKATGFSPTPQIEREPRRHRGLRLDPPLPLGPGRTPGNKRLGAIRTTTGTTISRRSTALCNGRLLAVRRETLQNGGL